MIEKEYNNKFSVIELAQEIWKDIPGFIGYYQVSNLGRAKSIERLIIDKNGKRKRIFKETLLSIAGDNKGYFTASLYKNYNKKSY